MAAGRGGGAHGQAGAWKARAPGWHRAGQAQRAAPSYTPFAFTPSCCRPRNGLWPQLYPHHTAPGPGAPGWDPAGPLWPTRRPGFSLEGPGKWEMADEAETGSAGLWFAGSDLFFISSRFAEIYENVFLVP